MKKTRGELLLDAARRIEKEERRHMEQDVPLLFSPYTHAARLLGYVLDEEEWKVKVHDDIAVSEEDTKTFLSLLEDYLRGKPLEYIFHYSELGEGFYVDERVLIPRWETEEFVHEKLGTYAGKDTMIIDIGTGSGFIGCMALMEYPWKGAILVDISEGALEVAKNNVEAHGLQERAFLMQGDARDKQSMEAIVTKAMEQGPKEIVIVANLPYIPHDAMEGLQRSVRNFEPHLALDGGVEGLEIIIPMLKHLEELKLKGAPIGPILLEMDPDNVSGLEDAVEAHDMKLRYLFEEEDLKYRFCEITLPYSTAEINSPM